MKSTKLIQAGIILYSLKKCIKLICCKSAYVLNNVQVIILKITILFKNIIVCFSFTLETDNFDITINFDVQKNGILKS